jgi:serine/threonine protein kinase
MYCLSSRKGVLGDEEKSEHHSGHSQSSNMETLDRQRQYCTYISPSECTGNITSIRSYEPPSFRSGECNDVSKYGKNRQEDHLSVEQERESRFQAELEKAHQKMKKKRSPSKRFAKGPPDISGDFESMVVTEQGSRDADRSVPEARNEGDSRNQLWRENQALRRALKQNSQLLECEREEKSVLQCTVENLKRQVDVLRSAQQTRSSFAGNRGQVMEYQYQQQLEAEQKKGQMIQQELETVKKENQAFREKLHVLVFQHGPNDAQKFQDIGPCTPGIVESSIQVGTYLLGPSLGEGHYGKVAIGIDSVTGKKFAIKVLNKHRINRFKDLQQVAMEIHVLKKYRHENIVHLQEVIHTPENLYLVTELCSMDLHRYHNEIGLSEDESQQVIIGVLKPLRHLHSHGICHLDLKPENILLSRNAAVSTNNITHYDVRLCDFGLVNMARNPRENRDIRRKGYVCGTPGFFAPEMILKKMFEGRRADMWSIGCIILEITLGFTQEWIESYDLIEKQPSAFRQGIEGCLQDDISPVHYPQHQKLLDIIHRCLTLDASKRIRSSEAIRHPWLDDSQDRDEGRHDSTNSFGSADTNLENPLFQFYSERNDLVSSAILN